MSLLPRGWRLSALLVLACGALGGLVAVQWRERSATGLEDVVGAAVRQDPAAKAVAPPPPYSPPALATFDEILERPLFAPDRRPADPPATAAPPPPVPLRARLEGVALIGDARVAVIRDLSTNEGLRLSKGMQYKGWTLEAVEPDRALLKRGDNQVHELKLEQKK